MLLNCLIPPSRKRDTLLDQYILTLKDYDENLGGSELDKTQESEFNEDINIFLVDLNSEMVKNLKSLNAGRPVLSMEQRYAKLRQIEI